MTIRRTTWLRATVVLTVLALTDVNEARPFGGSGSKTTPPLGTPAAPAPPLILTTSGVTVTVSGTRVQARADTTGHELWTQPAPPGSPAHVIGAADTVLVVASRVRSWKVDYALYRRDTGAPIVRRSLDALFGDVRVTGAAYVLSVSTTGAETRRRSIVLDGRTGREAATLPGALVAQNAAGLLFDTIGDVYDPYEPVRLRFHVVALPSLRTRVISWQVPARPKCGPVQRDPSGPTEEVTAQYVYETRHDNCGSFVVRFDWTRPEWTPVITSVR